VNRLILPPETTILRPNQLLYLSVAHGILAFAHRLQIILAFLLSVMNSGIAEFGRFHG